MITEKVSVFRRILPQVISKSWVHAAFEYFFQITRILKELVGVFFMNCQMVISNYGSGREPGVGTLVRTLEITVHNVNTFGIYVKFDSQIPTNSSKLETI